MNSSIPNTLSQVPLVNSTQILTQSVQVPNQQVVNPLPVPGVVPTAAVAPANIIVTNQVPGSVVPTTPIVGSIINTNTLNTPIVEEDYRLGRSILDDFRPTPYKSQISIGVNGMTNASIPLICVDPAPQIIGQSSIKDFL